MAVYFITGKLGAGKTLAAVGRARDYLRQGRPVATNIDLDLVRLMGPNSKATVTRLPDKPRVEDFVSLGQGGDPKQEGSMGMVLLDECATWLNPRTWNDPERPAFIDWLVQARKYGWDVFFIVQSIEAVDKQIRELVGEHFVICKRLDRLALPLVGGLFKALGLKQQLPRIHIGVVWYGKPGPQGFIVDRWVYRGASLFGAYPTEQPFVMDGFYDETGEFVDMRARYTLLSAYHLRGRYLGETTPGAQLGAQLAVALLYVCWYGERCIAQLAGRGREATPVATVREIATAIRNRAWHKTRATRGASSSIEWREGPDLGPA